MALMGAICGGLLILCALGFMVGEFLRFRRRKTPGYTGFISMRSISRRISGSIILIVLGLMLYFGLAVINFADSPVFFSVYWIICCLLALILFVMGLLDLHEVRQHRHVHHLKLLWQMTKDISKKR